MTLPQVSPAERWAILALLLAVGASGWLLERVDRGGGAPRIERLHEPDYLMDGVLREQTGTDGRLGSRLAAEHVVHYADDDTSELTAPALTLYRRQHARPWQVRAERGWVNAAGDVVVLLGAVEVWREAAGGGRSLEVLTRDLRVLPDEQYAETDAEATIRGPGTVTTGTGLRVNLAQGWMELRDAVRTEHDPRAGG